MDSLMLRGGGAESGAVHMRRVVIVVTVAALFAGVDGAAEASPAVPIAPTGHIAASGQVSGSVGPSAIGLRLLPGDGMFRAVWSAPTSKVLSYRLADRIRRAGSWSSWTYRTVPGSRTGMTVRARNGSRHQVRIRASLRAGPGEHSVARTVRVGVPGAPRRLATSQEPGYAAATWLSADPHAAPLEYHVVRVRRYQDDGTWSRWTSRRLSGAARRAAGARSTSAPCTRSAWRPSIATDPGRPGTARST